MSQYSPHAPMLDAAAENKEEFCSSPDQSLSRILAADKLIVLGNFSTRVGRSVDFWGKDQGWFGKKNQVIQELISLKYIAFLSVKQQPHSEGKGQTY
eukprot:g31126.t1